MQGGTSWTYSAVQINWEVGDGTPQYYLPSYSPYVSTWCWQVYSGNDYATNVSIPASYVTPIWKFSDSQFKGVNKIAPMSSAGTPMFHSGTYSVYGQIGVLLLLLRKIKVIQNVEYQPFMITAQVAYGYILIPDTMATPYTGNPKYYSQTISAITRNGNQEYMHLYGSTGFPNGDTPNITLEIVNVNYAQQIFYINELGYYYYYWANIGITGGQRGVPYL